MGKSVDGSTVTPSAGGLRALDEDAAGREGLRAAALSILNLRLDLVSGKVDEL